jgi:hypothetical protein
MLSFERAQAAVFGTLGGSLTIQAGANPQKFTPAIVGQAGLSDTELVGSIDFASAGLQITRVDGRYFLFSATASSSSNQVSPPGTANATASVGFVQGFTTATPQWLELSARVSSPPADADIFALLTLVRSGQPTPILSQGDTGGVSVSKAGLYPAGTFTVQGSINTAATLTNSHAGVIDGALLIADLADFNGSSLVDSADMTTLRNGLGSMTGTFASGNLDGDVDTDGADFLLFQRQLGTSSVAAPVAAAAPEPTSAAIGLGALLSIASYCRTRRSAARRASASPAR